MKKIFLIVSLVIIVLTFYACSSGNAEINQKATGSDTIDTGIQEAEEITDDNSEEQETEDNIEKEYIINTSTPAPSLGNNMLGEEGQQPISILLPPTYYDSDEKYPVLYYLHGFSESYNSLSNFYRPIKNQMESGELEEFIIVCATGKTKLEGGFYVNSPVTGNWEDYIVNDVISYMDSNFRTIAYSGSRGIAGFSMGGFGSINLALKHPDIFSYLFSLSPGLFDENGLKKAFEDKDWNIIFKNAYGAAFSPNTDLPEPYAEIPVFDGSEKDNETIANWENGFGNLENKVNDYLDKNIELKAILIEYGKDDPYEWIPEGCRYFSSILNDNGIDHQLVELEGGHNINLEIISGDMLPFFADNF